MDERFLENVEQVRQMLHEKELEKVRRAAATDLSQYWTGYCWHCGAPVEPPRRWCDADCRDEWERRKVNI